MIVDIQRRYWVHSRWWLFWLCAWIPIILLITFLVILLSRRRKRKQQQKDEEGYIQYNDQYASPQQPYDNQQQPNVQQPPPLPSQGQQQGYGSVNNGQRNVQQEGTYTPTGTGYSKEAANAEPESPPRAHTKN